MEWRRLIEIGCGILGWAPAQFWAASLPEWLATLDGWREAHGVRAESMRWRPGEIAALRALMERT